MTSVETLTGLRTAYAFVREQHKRAQSPIEEMRWAQWMRTYADDIAELVADAALPELAAVPA